jgi:hypothetical protein
LVGFFDVDNLAVISQQELIEAVRSSCTMLVLLTNETCDSEWCQHEWEVARQHRIPVKCIADLRFRKEDMLSQVPSINPHLMHFQWAEYTDKTRRLVTEELRAWIEALGSDSMGASVSVGKEPYTPREDEEGPSAPPPMSQAKKACAEGEELEPEITEPVTKGVDVVELVEDIAQELEVAPLSA